VAGDGHRGAAGEDLACEYLRRQAFVILERNYRCRAGEIDVVARDGETLVFVEVKERADASHGGAIEAVTGAKRRKVIRAAQLWASAHRESETQMRFDVVAIDQEPEGPAIRHERDAFDAEGC
jgi:putative endonuclease